MAKIQSSIGESNLNIPQNRNYVVSDESLGSRQVPQEINPAVAVGLRKKMLEQQEMVEQKSIREARHRIEILTGLGRKTKDIVVETNEGNLTFTLRTLKSFEQNCLAQVIESVDKVRLPDGKISFTPTGMYKIKTEALSHSLYLIDGQSVDVVLGTANMEYEEQVMARKDLISNMDHALTDHLFIQYEMLSAEARDGYAPRNAEEVEEVVEAIRKSGENA